MATGLIGPIILWLIVAIIVIAVVVYLVNWLYRRSTKEVSFVRTGLGGEKVVINGGVASLDEADAHLERVDGAMIGRAAYADPAMLRSVDHRIFGAPERSLPSRHDIARAMLPYVRMMHAAGVPLHHIPRHMLGLFAGQPGGRAWRRALGEGSQRPGAGAEVIEEALTLVPEPAAPDYAKLPGAAQTMTLARVPG